MAMEVRPDPACGLELWAGAECTVNRVDDRWFDQLRATGHHDRLDDIDRMAGLGIARLRLPVLWERVHAGGTASFDWRWSDARIDRLARLGVAPIIGLVHHGSGPAGVDVCDAGFIDGLSRFAEEVARRYPWVRDWTPVNEPLTTARFSALYGHWYPHARDIGSCLRATIVQVRAIAASMERIRAIIPGARLVQTEDLGRISGTAELEYQVRYENERRWLSFDLLAGRVDAEHPLRRHCEENGIAARALDRLVARPCMPDVFGINYYPTSDRFLDHRLTGYPAEVVGGNHLQPYADVESVRVAGVGIAGHRALVDEMWRRYRRPIALTEVHLGCTREEQLRWLVEAWRAARSARADGVDLRAVTTWSAFGAVDWHCLVTREEGRYEPGAFDVRAPQPRPTAIAHVARALARDGDVAHPLLSSRGWWHSASSRLYRRAHGPSEPVDRDARPLLIAGEGTFGDRMAARCAERGIASVRAHERVARSVWKGDPWAVVAVHGATLRGPGSLRGPELLGIATACHAAAIPLVAFSNDEVFRPEELARRESDEPSAVDPPGRARARLEKVLLATAPNTLLVRVGLLVDPRDGVAVPNDTAISISHVPDLLDAVLDLLVDGERGIWHGVNPVNASLPCRLMSERAWPMPPLDEALLHYARMAGVPRASIHAA
jgi:dTDP-4-dehydrorhamnose reductase